MIHYETSRNTHWRWKATKIKENDEREWKGRRMAAWKQNSKVLGFWEEKK